MMTPELMIAFAGYAFVTSITPGPNNAMLLASGANFGVARTIPHLFGIGFGFGAMVLLAGLGADSIFKAYPSLWLVLKVVGIVYMIYLAWLIATSKTSDSSVNVGSPMTFLGAAAFQWVNPKAWIMVIGAIGTFLLPGSSWSSIALLAAAYVLINAPCLMIWACFGAVMRRVLAKPSHLTWFNRSMAAVLLLSLYPVARDLTIVPCSTVGPGRREQTNHADLKRKL